MLTKKRNYQPVQTRLDPFYVYILFLFLVNILVIIFILEFR